MAKKTRNGPAEQRANAVRALRRLRDDSYGVDVKDITRVAQWCFGFRRINQIAEILGGSGHDFIRCRLITFKEEDLPLQRGRGLPGVECDFVVCNRPKNAPPKQSSKSNAPQFCGSYGAFYDSPAWLDLRYRVLVKYGRRCMLCGETSGQIHVDHVIPRSIDRSKELDFDNLQVLCRACNLGKSNRDRTDFRPAEAR